MAALEERMAAQSVQGRPDYRIHGWPTSQSRRTRLRQSRDALLERSKAQQALLRSVVETDADEVVARLQKLAPCIAAQLRGAAEPRVAFI